MVDIRRLFVEPAGVVLLRVETGRNPFPAASDPPRDGPKESPAPADISAASAPFVPAARRRALLVASSIGQLRWRPDYADTEVRAGYSVKMANSRGPDSLRDLAAATGATPVSLEQVVRNVDILFLVLPQKAIP